MSIIAHCTCFRTALRLLLLTCLLPCGLSQGFESPDSTTPEKKTFVLPEVFSDHMILQREAAVPVWGQAPDGTVVTVSFAKYKLSTTARNGKWQVSLPPMPTSWTSRELTISRNNGSRVT